MIINAMITAILQQKGHGRQKQRQKVRRGQHVLPVQVHKTAHYRVTLRALHIESADGVVPD